MTHPKRIFFAAAAVVLVASAATLDGQSLPNVPQVRMFDGDAQLRAFSNRVLLDTLATWHNVPGKPAEVYGRIRQILGTLKVPVERTDSTHGLLWSEGFVARSGRLGGKPTSTYLRCGSGPSGDYADIWRVNVAYAVFVRAGREGDTEVGIAMIGQAKDIAGSSSPAVLCSSKGRLESEIAQYLQNTTK